MLPKFSSFHYLLLSVIGSWCSWKRAFRWAVDYQGLKALWLLFRCRNVLELVLNVGAFSLYTKSSSFRHCEVSKAFDFDLDSGVIFFLGFANGSLVVQLCHNVG